VKAARDIRLVLGRVLIGKRFSNGTTFFPVWQLSLSSLVACSFNRAMENCAFLASRPRLEQGFRKGGAHSAALVFGRDWLTASVRQALRLEHDWDDGSCPTRSSEAARPMRQGGCVGARAFKCFLGGLTQGWPVGGEYGSAPLSGRGMPTATPNRGLLQRAGFRPPQRSADALSLLVHSSCCRFRHWVGRSIQRPGLGAPFLTIKYCCGCGIPLHFPA